MHIFLTGPKGVGKTTVIYKTLFHLGEDTIRLGGFFTHSGLQGDRDIYISPASLPKYYTESNKIATRNDIVPTVHTEVFENIGAEILKNTLSRDSQNIPKIQLIVMDELGFLEQYAPKFQEAVFKCLEGKIPILGTIRQGDVTWLRQVTSHSNVNLITVSPENRDQLAAELSSIIFAKVINKE